MTHDPRLKAQVLAALASGESAHRVADRLGVPRTTVRRWCDELWQVVNGKRPLKNSGIGEQVLTYVGESIETQRAQAVFMRDEGWLLKQSARDLAVLHGMVFDQAFRLLVALE